MAAASTPGQIVDGNGQPLKDQVITPGVGYAGMQGGAQLTDSVTGQPYAPVVVQQNATQSVNGTLQSAQAGNANGTPLALLGMASVLLTVNMAGFTGTVNFEVTEDNTNWDPLQMQQEGTNVIATSVTGATTTSIHLYEGSVAGLQSIRARTSGVGAGNVTVTAHAIPSTDAPRSINAVATAGQRATYRAAFVGLVPVTGCTDLFTITGAANKVVRVTRLEFSGTVATTAVQLDVQGIIRSSADLTGTSTSPAAVPLDANDPAAAATVRGYTANPGTLGTAVGTIRSDKAELVVAPAMPDRLVWDFGNRPAKEVILRSAAQVFALNLNAVTLANAALADVAIEWTEDII